MDIEEDSCTSLPRHQLVKSIVAALPVAGAQGGDVDEEPRYEYVTHLERNCDGQQLAAALSSREVKLYARETMDLTGQLAGHRGPLTQLAFTRSRANTLYSCSEDGDCKGWDTRTMKSVVKFGQSGEEIWSMALSYDGNLCATGKGSTVDFYDLRKAGKAVGSYSECHTDAVTQVKFHPTKHSFLITGSEDGLMCFLDTSLASEEEAVDSVMNAECAVRTVGFFGPEGEGVYCCTNTETLSLWDAAGARRNIDFGDVRALARGDAPTDDSQVGKRKRHSQRGWGVSVDYIVGCQYEAEADRLRLVAGGFEGGGCLATVAMGGITPDAVLEGGHREQIRTFDWLGQTVVTGGEDAKMCMWRMPESGNAERADRGGDDSAMDDVEGAAGSSSCGSERRADNRAGRAYQPYDGRRR